MNKGFVVFAMLSALLICAEYAITRPTSNALFLTLFSIQAYPWVWLATVPLNFLSVYLYNRFLPRYQPLRLIWIFAIFTIVINTLGGFLYTKVPKFLFFQFAWKDIYVLFMLKQLWSMIHSTISSTRAKYLYGCIYGVGTIGAISGSLVPAFLSPSIGSENILFLTAPIYLALLFAYTMAFRRSKIQADAFASSKGTFPLIRKSPILITILALVIFMQGSAALMEYQFNAHLELNIFEKDSRAAYYGKLMTWVNSLSLVLQFTGGIAAVRFFGLKWGLFLIPLLLCCSACVFAVLPSFAVISVCFVFLKGLEFSIFGVMREMLYIPLEIDAKFRAKAVIDVFAYRTSKAFISLGLLISQGLIGALLLPMTSYISIAVFIGWIVTIAIFFRKAELTKKISSMI